MRPQTVTADEALAALPAWRVAEGRPAIARSFRFKDFRQAFAFMTLCAEAAERLDHHPEWSNTYNRVDVVLTTHSTGGLTALDVELAGQMDALAEAVKAP